MTQVTLNNVPKKTERLASMLGNNGKDVSFIPASLEIEVYDWDAVTNPELTELRKIVPKVDQHYRFRKEVVRDWLAWFKVSQEALFLHGPTGSGKSSFMKQICARLGIPLFQMTFSNDTELAEVFGHYVLGANGETVFRYGPASLAAKYGCPVMFDEIGRGNPSTVVGLNGLFDEGAPFVITGNGETVVPEQGFRIVVTDNTNLAGDESGSYSTAMVQDKSIVDRVGMVIQVGYPAEEERELLSELLNELAPDDKALLYWFDQEGLQVSTAAGVRKGTAVSRDDFIEGILQVRDMIRKQSRDCGNQDANALERTMSVRTLKRWMSYCIAFIGAPNMGQSALHYAVERALTGTCTPSTKIAIHAMVKSVFGVSETLK